MLEPWHVWALTAVGWLVAFLAMRAWWRGKAALRSERSSKRSQSTRYGQLTEQFAPWMEGWPFDARQFRFLGSPIDGVQFTDDAVYLVEIKSAGSRRSPGQTKVREMVRAGKVGWIEFRVDERGVVDRVEPWIR